MEILLASCYQSPWESYKRRNTLLLWLLSLGVVLQVKLTGAMATMLMALLHVEWSISEGGVLMHVMQGASWVILSWHRAQFSELEGGRVSERRVWIFYIHVGSLFGLEPQVSILIARVRLMILCGCVVVEIPHRWSEILRSKFLSLWHQDLVTVLLFIFKACSFFRAGWALSQVRLVSILFISARRHESWVEWLGKLLLLLLPLVPEIVLGSLHLFANRFCPLRYLWGHIHGYLQTFFILKRIPDE